MTRPTRMVVNTAALVHNIQRVRFYAPNSKIMAMVKADAYGCGISRVVPMLDEHIALFGVASLEEAHQVKAAGGKSPCVLLSGIFSAQELAQASKIQCQMVVHQFAQLDWIQQQPCAQPIQVWVKVNTGMNRLGFYPDEISEVLRVLRSCPGVDNTIGLMTHFACADEPQSSYNQKQLNVFNHLDCDKQNVIQSLANSAAIIAIPEAHADMVRPGIMMYGVSPFLNKTAKEFDLHPVMRFESEITAIHRYPANSPIGYGATWQSPHPTLIGIVPVGYGDGYPRHIRPNTCVSVQGHRAPIVGRVSMDMLTVDLTEVPNASMGMAVELWGEDIPIETIAQSAGTIGYELLTQVTSRPRTYAVV